MNRQQPISEIEKIVRAGRYGEIEESYRIASEMRKAKEEEERLRISNEKKEELEMEKQLFLEKEKREEQEIIAKQRQRQREKEEVERKRILIEQEEQLLMEKKLALEKKEQEEILAQQRLREEEEERQRIYETQNAEQQILEQAQSHQQFEKQKQEIEIVSQLSQQIYNQNLYDQNAQTIEDFKKSKEISQIINLIENLNPHIKNATKNQVDEFINYQTVKESIKPLPIQKKNQLETDTQNFLSNVKSQYTNSPIQSLAKQQQTELCMAILYTKLTEDGHEVFISNQKEEDQNANTLKKQQITTNQQDNSSYINYKFSNIQFDDFMKSKGKRDHLISTLIQMLSQNYNLTPEEILLVDVSAGSVITAFQVQASVSQVKSKLIQPDDIASFLKKHDVEFAPSSPKDIQVNASSATNNFIVSLDYFSPQYNFYWDESHTNNTTYRGSIKYKDGTIKPQRYNFPVHYTGIAINVSQYMVSDRSWFGDTQDPRTWIVLFHGTKNKGVSGILKDKQIVHGPADAMSKHVCQIQGGLIPEKNVYLADKVSVSEGYSNISFNGGKYDFIYQCRVDPSIVRFYTHYLVQEENITRIRPYRFLIRKR